MNYRKLMSVRNALHVVAVLTVFGQAQAEERPHRLMEGWQQMSPDERQAMRARLKQEWSQLSPEERDARRQKVEHQVSALSPEEKQRLREQVRTYWQQMTPEERQSAHEQWRSRGDAGGRRGPGGQEPPADRR